MAATASSVTRVDASATAVPLAAANPARRGLIVENDSAAVLYLKLGAGASSASRTVAVPAGGLYELPAVAPTPNETVSGCYAGVVTGAWASATGAANVTEVS